MPRSRHRFSKLHQTLKETNYTATSGAAGEYFNYLKGTNKLTVPRKPAGKYLEIFNVGVLPFGDEPDGGTAVNAYQATMTVQADNIRALFSATDAAYGIERDLTKTKLEPDFYAAKAEIRVVTTADLSGAKIQHQSQITKRSYKSFNVRAGGVPYGRTTSVAGATTEGGQPATPTIQDVTEEQVRTALLTALKGATGGQYTCTDVSFIPEVFEESRSFDRVKPTSAATDIPAQ